MPTESATAGEPSVRTAGQRRSILSDTMVARSGLTSLGNRGPSTVALRRNLLLCPWRRFGRQRQELIATPSWARSSPSKRLGSQTGVAVQLFNGRRACFAVADSPTLAVGSPVAVFRDAETTKEEMLTELNVRFTILRYVAAASLGLAPSWADCDSYDKIEAPDAALLLTYAELLRMHDAKPKEFAELARLFNLEGGKQGEAREKFRRRHQYAGKIICAARTAWEHLRSGRGTRQSFLDYFEALTGQRPSNRGQSCAKAYRELVLTGRISEDDYDIHSSEAIQMASRVISKIGDDLNAPAIVEVATILRGRSRATLRELRALLARLHEDAASGQVVLRPVGQEGVGSIPMTFADAVRLVASIVEAGHHGAMIEGLVAIAGSTTNDQIASELAGASSRIRVALKKADGAGRQRFVDAAIDEWITPARSVQFITVDSLKAEHLAAVRKVKQLSDKLAAAGAQVPQNI
jgi:hypothetical protein